MNIKQIRNIYSWLGRLMVLTLLSIGGVGALVVGSEDLSPALYMVPGVLYALSVGALIFLGNALGKFGPKYAVAPLFLPFLGFLLSYLRLRQHVKRAFKLAGSAA
jgi:hypothetical protein